MSLFLELQLSVKTVVFHLSTAEVYVMIFLNSYDVSATIKQRYGTIIYTLDFTNNTEYGGSDELEFEITIDSDAFISNFIADIDGELFYGKTKEKNKAKIEYDEAKEIDEHAILIYQPYNNIPNVFKIKTNIDSKSTILLKIQIEQHLTKKFNINYI